MKKLLLLAVLLLGFEGVAYAQQATDVTVRQRNAFNTGWLDRFLSPPADGANGIVYINGSTVMPDVLLLGTGLSINSGVLNSTVTTGPAGPPGIQGVKGDTGAASTVPGPQGPIGLTGPAGNNATQVNTDWSAISGVAQLLNKPTTLSGYGITDAASSTALAAKYNSPTGSVSQYVRGDGSLSTFPAQVQSDWNASSGLGVILNKPTLSQFTFGAPAARTLTVSTQYQAVDNTKAAITTLSPSCQNATTLVAASSCTMQVRQSAASGLTCANGTVTATWTSVVQLGLVFNQTSGSPVDVKLPIGGYFILCATAGTFTVAAVEQSAG